MAVAVVSCVVAVAVGSCVVVVAVGSCEVAVAVGSCVVVVAVGSCVVMSIEPHNNSNNNEMVHNKGIPAGDCSHRNSCSLNTHLFLVSSQRGGPV